MASSTDTEIEPETEEVFTTPQKDPKPIDSVITTAAISLSNIATSNIATTDVESEVPVDVSASSITNSRKPPPPANITLLSPTTRSRSLSPRKRATPEKYVPSYTNSISKSRKSTNLSASKSKRHKAKAATPSSQVEVVVDDDSTVEDKAIVTDNNAYILECLNESVANKLVSDEDKSDALKLKEATNSERRYIKSMCVITKRSASNISWAGWTIGYFKEIKLSEYAKIYRKTSKYIDYIFNHGYILYLPCFQ